MGDIWKEFTSASFNRFSGCMLVRSQNHGPFSVFLFLDWGSKARKGLQISFPGQLPVYNPTPLIGGCLSHEASWFFPWVPQATVHISMYSISMMVIGVIIAFTYLHDILFRTHIRHTVYTAFLLLGAGFSTMILFLTVLKTFLSSRNARKTGINNSIYSLLLQDGKGT